MVLRCFRRATDGFIFMDVCNLFKQGPGAYRIRPVTIRLNQLKVPKKCRAMSDGTTGRGQRPSNSRRSQSRQKREMRLGSIRVRELIVKHLDLNFDEWSEVGTNGHHLGRMVTTLAAESALPTPPRQSSGCIETIL